MSLARSTRGRVVVALAMAIGVPARAGAQTADDVQSARNDFLAATEFVKNAQWGEALAAFERSAARRPHALTTYNVGACERALGRYTRARKTLKRALEQNQAAAGKELPGSYAEDAKAWVADIDRMLAHLRVRIDPADAAMAVDGKGLEPDASAKGVFVVGVQPPGAGVRVPAKDFELLADPGSHVFTLSRRGFTDAIVNKTFAPGSKSDLVLVLDRLPATIRVSSNRPGAVVSVSGVDVGVAPVELSRQAGSYEIVVRKPGFVAYRSVVDVRPGEESKLEATLPEESTPVYKSFWFWGAAATVVAGAAVGTYFLTRPEPQRPAPDGGGLGYVFRTQ